METGGVAVSRLLKKASLPVTSLASESSVGAAFLALLLEGLLVLLSYSEGKQKTVVYKSC